MISQILYFVSCLCMIIKFLQWNSTKSILKPPKFSGYFPIIGHSWKLLGDRKHVLTNIISMSKECLENGGMISLNIGLRYFYLLSDPEDCLKAANFCLEKDDYYSFAKPLIGNGLTTADVSSFGENVPELRDIQEQYLNAVDEILDIFVERFQKFWLHNNFIYNWSNLRKKQDKCIKSIKTFSSAILNKMKMDRKQIKTNLNDNEKFTPFISWLLEIFEKTNHYSEEDILYETNTIIAAGYDTSSVTITLVLILLGSHREIQKKVYEELQEVFHDSDRDINKEDLPKLVYLEAVIKETIRLYPIAPFIARKITEDVQLKNYTLNAGKSVGILVWALHRHPVWGPDVEIFRPERWLDGSLPSNPNAFGGFSIGKRACIGKIYALMSIKTVISHLLRKYEVLSDIRKLELEMHGSLRLAAGHMISIEERTVTESLRYI